MTEATPSPYAALDRPEVAARLFHPRRESGPAYPGPAVDVRIPVDGPAELGGRFHMAGKGAPGILFFHGNGEIVADYDDLVSVSMPMMNAGVRALWFSLPNAIFLLPIPLVTLILFVMIWRDLQTGREYRPFFMSQGVFLLGYLGLGISLWPWVVPFSISFRQAAAAGPSQSLLLVGTVILLPVVLGYTAFCYYLFRGKASHEGVY